MLKTTTRAHRHKSHARCLSFRGNKIHYTRHTLYSIKSVLFAVWTVHILTHKTRSHTRIWEWGHESARTHTFARDKHYAVLSIHILIVQTQHKFHSTRCCFFSLHFISHLERDYEFGSHKSNCLDESTWRCNGRELFVYMCVCVQMPWGMNDKGRSTY